MKEITGVFLLLFTFCSLTFPVSAQIQEQYPYRQSFSINISRLFLQEINVKYELSLSERHRLNFTLGYNIPQSGDDYYAKFYEIALFNGNIGFHERMMHGPRLSLGYTYIKQSTKSAYFTTEFFAEQVSYDKKYYHVKIPIHYWDPTIYHQSMKSSIAGIRFLFGNRISVKEIRNGVLFLDIYYGVGFKFGTKYHEVFKHYYSGQWYPWTSSVEYFYARPTVNIGFSIGYGK